MTLQPLRPLDRALIGFLLVGVLACAVWAEVMLR